MELPHPTAELCFSSAELEQPLEISRCYGRRPGTGRFADRRHGTGRRSKRHFPRVQLDVGSSENTAVGALGSNHHTVTGSFTTGNADFGYTRTRSNSN